MSTSNPALFLQEGGAGDDGALLNTQFKGEVLESFKLSSILYNLRNELASTTNVTAGETFSFPVFGDDPTPEEHVGGTEMLGMSVNMDQGTVTLDEYLVVHLSPKFRDLRITHFDVLRPYAQQLGRAIANKLDTRMIITGIKAARTAAVTGIHSGGNAVARSGGAMATVYAISAAGAALFITDIETLAKQMDEDDVPRENRALLIPPHMAAVLGQDRDIFNSDYNRNADNELNRRSIARVADFSIIVHNNFPSTNVTAATEANSKYQGDFTYNNASASTTLSEGWSGTIANDGQPVALALCGSQAIGYVEAEGVNSYMEPQHTKNVMFMKAQALCGFGVLNPECAGVIHATD